MSVDINHVWLSWQERSDETLFLVTDDKQYCYWRYGMLFFKKSNIISVGVSDSEINFLKKKLLLGDAIIKQKGTKEIFFSSLSSINLL